MAILLHREGIKGEASDKNHKDWMNVVSWTWGAKRSVTSSTSTQGDRESSNAVISDLKISKYMDSATPKLFLESVCGTGKDVILRLTKTGKGEGGDVYMEYVLKNAIISEYTVGGHEEDIDRPTENITISFVEVEVKYTPYDEDGNATAPIAVGFDTASNTKK